ncbi:peptide-methionine (R)-S-oxide reductase [Tenacibaculum skagerrakense]|uniref:peptide-methionine (R)-S-oxide reductase n=1 Tax=Tenacibaculum skagerrakense TaxID=186571 RepID=A0A4R2NNV4_9FLAO|nr:peptide-methionine (R)-S-oxide reductase MsrB [Tenacibaculum skagerrakense]TCP23397.1 peptide-methionine (R)-S-oxide reductase [Tenacibaculum skagerrakense]
MKNLVLYLSIVSLFISCQSTAQNKKPKKKYKVEKSAEEWKKALTPMQYHVLREAGTERPNSSEYTYFKGKGTFVCAACKTPLYKSERKYNSGTGWPSFDKAIEENIETDTDYKIGYARTELKCNTCGGHLGHRFNDGPKETTGLRDCINGVALDFVPSKK